MEALDLPPLSELSEYQIRGITCVHCGVHLDNSDAIDLGEQRAQLAGSVLWWFPRACPQCGTST